MKVTRHVAIRLLERVFGIATFNNKEIKNAKKLIEKDIAQVCARGNSFALPSFSDMKAIVVQNHIVTIVDKKSMYMNKGRSLQLLYNHSQEKHYEY